MFFYALKKLSQKISINPINTQEIVTCWRNIDEFIKILICPNGILTGYLKLITHPIAKIKPILFFR